MRLMRRALLLMIALAPVAGCSSTPFTAMAGSSGASGASGASSGGASSGGASSGGASGSAGAPAAGAPGTDAGIPCGPSTGTCPSDMVCNSCTDGICVPRDSVQSSGALNPVCGCDGLTYWNLSVAYQLGKSVRHQVDCSTVGLAKSCTPGSCPSGAYCNMMQPNVCVSVSNSTGTCWVLPKPCVPAPEDQACGSTNCVPRCELIKNEVPWYVSGPVCQTAGG